MWFKYPSYRFRIRPDLASGICPDFPYSLADVADLDRFGLSDDINTMRPALHWRKPFYNLRIRPDLASCIAPGFPWLERKAYLLYRTMKRKRDSIIMHV